MKKKEQKWRNKKERGITGRKDREKKGRRKKVQGTKT